MRKARTLSDIKAHPWVQSAHSEDDGFREDGRPSYWVYLHGGFMSPDSECGTIHEGTVSECCDALNHARRCTVEEIEAGYVTTTPLEEAQANWEKYDV